MADNPNKESEARRRRRRAEARRRREREIRIRKTIAVVLIAIAFIAIGVMAFRIHRRNKAEEEAALAASRVIAEEQAAAEATRKAAEEQAALEASRKAAEEEAALEASRKAAEEEAALEASRKAAEEEAASQASREKAEEEGALAASRRAAEEQKEKAEAEQQITIAVDFQFKDKNGNKLSISEAQKYGITLEYAGTDKGISCEGSGDYSYKITAPSASEASLKFNVKIETGKIQNNKFEETFANIKQKAGEEMKCTYEIQLDVSSEKNQEPLLEDTKEDLESNIQPSKPPRQDLLYWSKKTIESLNKPEEKARYDAIKESLEAIESGKEVSEDVLNNLSNREVVLKLGVVDTTISQVQIVDAWNYYIKNLDSGLIIKFKEDVKNQKDISLSNTFGVIYNYKIKYSL